MSRGPGRWQRAILDATETAADAVPKWVALDAIGVSVASSGTDADEETLSHTGGSSRRRAAHTLEDRGVVEVTAGPGAATLPVD